MPLIRRDNFRVTVLLDASAAIGGVDYAPWVLAMMLACVYNVFPQ
jgi:hypothetical protein